MENKEQPDNEWCINCKHYRPIVKGDYGYGYCKLLKMTIEDPEDNACRLIELKEESK